MHRGARHRPRPSSDPRGDHTGTEGSDEGTSRCCPVLDHPDPDCFCLNLTSLSIQIAVHYCLDDFRQCPIYRLAIQKEVDP